MPVAYGPTHAIVPRPLPSAPKRQAPVLSYQQRVELAAARKAKQDSVEKAIAAWYTQSTVLAADLASQYGRTPEHFLNRMFSGALTLHAAPRKPNGYNAFLHHVASEEGGMNVVELAETQRERYNQLSDEEKQQYIDELVEYRAGMERGLRLDQRSRTQDVNHVMKEVAALLSGLQARVGVESFLCVVRNNTDFQLRPRWFYSHPNLEEFLIGNVRKFDPDRIGALAEAFAVSGSDYFAQLRNSGEKVNYLKGEIRDMVIEGLVTITNNPAAQMSYVNFTRDVQIKLCVTMVGWTHSQWRNPSELSNSIPPLKELRDALKSGQCKFIVLSPAELAAIKKEFDEQLRAGAATRKKRSDAGKPRKKRSDAGKSRKKTAMQEATGPVVEEQEGTEEDAAPSAKRRRVAEPTSNA